MERSRNVSITKNMEGLDLGELLNVGAKGQLGGWGHSLGVLPGGGNRQGDRWGRQEALALPAL